MRARIVVEQGEAKPDAIDLSPEQAITLGRSRDNSIVLRDEHASRLHARIHFENGRWVLRDFGLNGTRVDGERVQQQSELDHGQEIRIGDTRMRFTTEGGSSASTSGSMLSSISRTATKVFDRPGDPPSPAGLVATTRLQPDDLTALVQFMAVAVDESNAQEVVRQALQLILNQTHAAVAGYLGVDPSDPVAKVITPASSQLDAPLCRQLTRRVQRDGGTVWLGTDMADTRPHDSLMPFADALCVPLKAGVQIQGAVHVYRMSRLFAERDVRFCEAVALFLAGSLHVLRTRRNLEAENSRLRAHAPAIDDLVGDSPAMQQLRQSISRAAPQNTPVLVRGEGGVGKELVALALHRQSSRSRGPLVVVNCGAIAPSLFEAELFGYVRGAFSGADHNYPGLFTHADEGTLYFDEVAELTDELQSKLHRVIESKSFRPVGASAETRTDVRIVAATNRNLEDEVAAGRFREDLYGRLKATQIGVPALREHAEDVPFLAQYFLDRLAIECRRQVKIADAAVKKLMSYSWPGNVRQLRAVLESAALTVAGDTIDADAIDLR